MADTQTPTLVHAPMVASWTAPVIDTGKVHDELDRLWGEWSEAKRASNIGSAPEAALMRASTLNLIAIAATPKEAEWIEATVSSLTEFTPSRTVILVQSGAPKSGGLSIRVSVHEHSLAQGQAAIRFESVTIAAKRGSDELLASVTSPLLVAELPDFLWLPRGEIAGNALLSDLLEIADRVIVDTSTLQEPGGNLRYLADLARQPKPAPKLTDLTWSRLTPWRQLLAQFFDQPAARACLDCVDEVAISYGAADDAGRDGLTAGLLTAGWLATRLDWRAPGELVRGRDGWRLTLRAGPKGRSREVLLSLRPTDSAPARSCLGAVTLIAHGACAGVFTVERSDEVGITTVSETPAMPKVSRMVYGRQQDDAYLLSQELRNFGGDQIYEEALVFAADLWPDGEEG
jgi:glucose-6-phosphate dehydrogenase assembly protein OpcA